MNASEALRNFITKGGVSYKEGASSWIFTCPRCSKARKLYIHKQNLGFICFVCKENSRFYGRAEFALAELYNLSVSEVRYLLYGAAEKQFKKYIEFELKELFDYEEIVEETALSETIYPPNFVDSNSPAFKAGREYLLSRGLKQHHIDIYNIKYHPYWRTVVFPVEYKGQLFGWQERGTQGNFKYTSKGLRKDKVLMFQDRLDISSHAVLCEGPVDALKCHPCGGNVASMGKAVSEAQLKIIKERCNKLYLALDPDATGEIDKICRKMYDVMPVYIMLPPHGKKDFGECAEEEALERFYKAQPYYGQIIYNLGL